MKFHQDCLCNFIAFHENSTEFQINVQNLFGVIMTDGISVMGLLITLLSCQEMVITKAYRNHIKSLPSQK